jgi:hypothetical protein
MKPGDPIVFLELQVIQKIIDDETWLEGERRGCRVDPHDPVVMETVCAVVLRIGAELRASLRVAYEARIRAMGHDNQMAA